MPRTKTFTVEVTDVLGFQFDEDTTNQIRAALADLRPGMVVNVFEQQEENWRQKDGKKS